MEKILFNVDLLLSAVKKAGQMAIDFKAKGLEVTNKKDGSVVTNADKAIDVFFIKTIREDLKNNALIISEEGIGSGEDSIEITNESFWSIDPIDSTKSFINGGPYYTLNIAYVVNNEPVFGIIYAPAFETLWWGAKGLGCFKQIGEQPIKQIFVRDIPKDGAILMTSEEQITPRNVLEELNIKEDIKLPSSLKFCYIAEGKADYYFRRRNKACDWDISPGHALIVAAGGSVVFKEPVDFKYGKPPYLAPALLASGKK